MKRFINAHKKAVAAIAATAIVVGSGIGAFAYFTSTGQGSGTASVGTSTDWAVAQGITTGGPLTPGGATESIAYTVTNNSSGHQQLHQVTIQVATTVGTSPGATPGVYTHGTGTPACTKNDFTVGGAAQGAVATQTIDQDLAPLGVYHGTVVVTMTNHADTVAGDGLGNQDNCKNENPPLFYAAS
jgi:hypothetical protein